MKMKLSRKIIISYSVFLLIFSTVFFSFYSIYIYRNLTSTSQNNLEQLADRTSSELDSVFREMDKILLYVISNPDVCEGFTTAHYSEISDYDLSTQISPSMTSVFVPNSASKYRINLYNRSGNFVSTGLACSHTKKSEIFDSEDYSLWYDSLPTKEHLLSYGRFQQDYLSLEEKSTISLYRNIYDSKSYRTNVGVAEIQCPYSFFDNMLNSSSHKYSYVVFDETGNVFYPRDVEEPALFHALYADILKNEQSSGTLEKYVYSFSESDYTPFTLAVLQLKSDNSNLTMPIILFGVAFYAASVVLGVAFIVVISKIATRPLHELMVSVEHVSSSSQEIVLKDDLDNDEISRLNTAFSGMFQRLQRSSQEIIKIKEQELDAQRIALQSQMNPHFLFNMLTVIKAFSRANETNKISYTCDYLADVLRYCGNYEDHWVSIEDELNHTENYLRLMQIRYEEMFTYYIHFESDLFKALQLPKLSLQPLVENCFQHGFKHTLPPWHIHIRFWIEDHHWYLSITDNGVGISNEKIQDIFQKAEDFIQSPADQLNKLKIGGMGLLNTIVRLRLSRKEAVDIHVETLPEGTRVLIGGTLSASDTAC